MAIQTPQALWQQQGVLTELVMELPGQPAVETWLGPCLWVNRNRPDEPKLAEKGSGRVK